MLSNLRLAMPVYKPFVSNRLAQSRPRFFNCSEAFLKEQISRDGRFIRERRYIDSRYSECYDHKSLKSSASITCYTLPEYYNSLTSFLSPFPARPLVCQGLMESPRVLTVLFDTSKRISRKE